MNIFKNEFTNSPFDQPKSVYLKNNDFNNLEHLII